MNQTIFRISEIEAAAVALMNDANEKKRAYGKETKRREEAFDRQLTEDMDRELNTIRCDMRKRKEQELSLLKEDTQKQMELLNKEYEEQHEDIASQVLKTLLGE